MVVESELRASEVSIPIGLIWCNVVANVSTDVAVGVLSLSVSLWVVSSTEVEE